MCSHAQVENSSVWFLALSQSFVMLDKAARPKQKCKLKRQLMGNKRNNSKQNEKKNIYQKEKRNTEFFLAATSTAFFF